MRDYAQKALPVLLVAVLALPNGALAERSVKTILFPAAVGGFFIFAAYSSSHIYNTLTITEINNEVKAMRQMMKPQLPTSGSIPSEKTGDQTRSITFSNGGFHWASLKQIRHSDFKLTPFFFYSQTGNLTSYCMVTQEQGIPPTAGAGQLVGYLKIPDLPGLPTGCEVDETDVQGSVSGKRLEEEPGKYLLLVETPERHYRWLPATLGRIYTTVVFGFSGEGVYDTDVHLCKGVLNGAPGILTFDSSQPATDFINSPCTPVAGWEITKNKDYSALSTSNKNDLSPEKNTASALLVPRARKMSASNKKTTIQWQQKTDTNVPSIIQSDADSKDIASTYCSPKTELGQFLVGNRLGKDCWYINIQQKKAFRAFNLEGKKQTKYLTPLFNREQPILWQEYHKDSGIPSGALIAGYDSVTGQPLYFCSYYDNDILIRQFGVFAKETKECIFFPVNFNKKTYKLESTSTGFDLLVTGQIQ
ncbi:hypothetical protein GZ77_22290 [Endozoicomonas montiporae]|uniref:Uncharacterized protein n=2 Tax=Endozoicomonas montiporae TaxID=1027273 RepID=A0A081N083_9GAMM|nr:hypothetical protein [Endozoicomonas montiporae]AMO54309.1 hypothetical protein EZMO1_0035 [Endozoicomonas montiporae CL-33]KEQ11856.1 hypothetical protein GZ77_22290 [Endozoicomonas montiporae]